jgi:LuxR family transcriptional regulator, maltose regulon positive regulatory protein
MTGGPQAPWPAVEEGFLAAYAERDWPRTVSMLDRHWTSLVFSPAAFEQFFDAVRTAPEDELRKAPKAALFGEGIGRLPSGSVAVTLPGSAARIDQTLQAGSARDLVEIAVLAMVARRVNGLPHDAAAIAQASRPLVRAASTTRFSPAADLAAYWHLQAGQAALHAGDLEQARLDFDHAWTFRGKDVTGYVATSAAPFSALLAALAGDATESTRWQAETDRLEPAGRSLIEWDTMERPRLVARLLEAVDRLDVDAGARLTDTLLPQLAFDEIWPVTLFGITRHLVNAERVDRAEQLIESTVQLHPRAPSASMHAAFVTLARADVALALRRGTVLGRLLAGADAAPLAGLRSVCAIQLEILAGDLPRARRLAVVAEHGPTDQRMGQESGLLRRAVDLALGEPAEPLPGPLAPSLRRTASLLPPELNDRLRASCDGVPPPHAGLSGAHPVVVKLTPREARALEALAGPGSLPEIAERLFISRNTLKSQLRALYAKLDVSSRDEAVELARRLGLLENDEGPPP